MVARRLMILSTTGVLLFGACAIAAPGDDPAIVIREDALLQRMVLSPDGKVVATVGVTSDSNSTVKLRDMQTGKLIRTLVELKDSHLEIAFSREFLAIAVNGGISQQEGAYREIRLYDAESFELQQKIDGRVVADVASWTALALSSDGRRLAAAGTKPPRNFLKLWHIEKDRLIPRDADVGTPPPADGRQPRSRVQCLVFSRDGRLLAAGFNDSQIRLFSALSGEQLATLKPDSPQPIRIGFAGLAFAPDSATLACVGSDAIVRLWDVTERKLGKVLKGHPSQAAAIAFSPDGSRLVTGGLPSRPDGHGEIFIWDVRSGERKQILSDLTLPVTVLAITPDGKTLAVCAGAANDDATGKGYTTLGELRFVKLE